LLNQEIGQINKMALRKAGAYSKKKVRPYTRKSTKKSKSYIKTIPQHKITKFNMGDLKGYESGKYNIVLRLISKENVQIRDNALEAVRQMVNRNLEKQIPGQFFFAVRVFPHHILRENKMLTAAGADRMQTGMQLSFGKTTGRAAIVKENQDVFLIAVSGQKNMNISRKILSSAKARLPCKTQIILERRK